MYGHSLFLCMFFSVAIVALAVEVAAAVVIILTLIFKVM